LYVVVVRELVGGRREEMVAFADFGFVVVVESAER
jgi:hypothetical protein